MKKILFTLLALTMFVCANAAETINVVSIEENFYVPSDAQYAPYYRCDMFAEDGLKYSFVIEKRLDSNGMPVNDRVYTLNDMDDWASYVMGGMYEYYDYQTVKFVRTVDAGGKVHVKADVTDERGKSYSLVYPAEGSGDGETYTYQAQLAQAAYFGTYTSVEGDWLLIFADENETPIAEIDIQAKDGEHIAGTYSTADGTVATAEGTSVFYINGKEEAVVKNGSITLSCLETDNGPAYNVTAAFQDNKGRNFVINRTIVQFLAYDVFGYSVAEQTGQDIDYMITLKDTETTGIRNILPNIAEENKTIKAVRNGKVVIKRGGKTFNIDGTMAK